MKKEQTINLNGTFYSAGKLISTENRGFLYGDSVFETIRFDEKALLWPLHYARLLRGAAILGYIFPPLWTEDFLKYELQKTVKENRGRTGRVRLTIFRNDGGKYLPSTDLCNYLISFEPDDSATYLLPENPVNIGLYEDIRKSFSPLSSFKNGNSLIYVMAARKARHEGWQDILILNQHDRICECSTGNVFIVQEDQLITPPLEEGGVMGVMREHLLRILPEQGWKLTEKELSIKEVQQAQEIWLTNCSRGITPVSQWNSRHYTSHKAEEARQLLIASIKE